MIYANPVVGRTGLGNMMFSWARAEVFCKQNNAEMLAPQWTNVCRIGPWLRREKFKRYYLSDFVNTAYIHGVRRGLLLHMLKHYSEEEFASKVSDNLNCVVDFSGMKDLFLPFIDYQPYIKERINFITAPRILGNIAKRGGEEFIGVHIRRGDFINAKWSIGDRWYINAINQALADLGRSDIEIHVFSDADQSELSFLSDEFSNVVYMPKAPAIQDLLMMATAKSLVCTSKSSFSLWAVFLGEVPSYWSSCWQPPSMGRNTDNCVRIID